MIRDGGILVDDGQTREAILPFAFPTRQSFFDYFIVLVSNNQWYLYFTYYGLV